MERALLSQRFGRGAARLAIGAPLDAPSLSRAARSPIAGEGVWVAMPVSACAALALLIGFFVAREDDATDFVTDPTVILADAWEIPLQAPLPAPDAPIEQDVSRDIAPIEARTEAPNDPIALAESTPPPAPAPPRLDLAALAMTSAPSVPERSADSAARPSVEARPAGLPTARSVTELALAVPRSDRAGSAPVLQASDPALAASAPRPDVARRTIAPALTQPPRKSERQQFLEALHAESDSTRSGVTAPRALPPVATPTSAAAREVRDATLALAGAEGWHAVPLDDLPDCQPAGRQDALKRRILRAAAERPTCHHAEGAYRFLETRNLNAFLMWSRSQPASSLAASGPRDACAVLERALRCLEGHSSKELEAR